MFLNFSAGRVSQTMRPRNPNLKIVNQVEWLSVQSLAERYPYMGDGEHVIKLGGA